MDSVPDSALTNSPNINSVLKPPKPRVPLKDLMAAGDEDNTAARKRRVSFANVNKIKEFSAGAESMVVCQTPAYEEPFYVSSDSSYPSGVDGWTPAKELSTHGKSSAIDPEKENVSMLSSRMLTGMELTGLVGNTRYSVNGMDFTEVANANETQLNQQTRFSVGMSLTNVVGHPLQNTRYSGSGMDLTGMNNHQALPGHRTSLSMGMDFTNVTGHFTHNTRYSINGMDLTEVANPQQTFFDQRSTRYSVGMDMTNVVGNSMKSVRYSCGEMDLTEAANPYCFQNQSLVESPSANCSMDDSDALELTDAVGGVQLSAMSPRASLKENILYSVNNTRYSVNSMDVTRGVGSRLSTARRKSSRYSLVNMDLTEAINNSCDDLEFTQAVGIPRIKEGSARNSMCAMDFTEAIVNDEGMSRLSTDNMECTGVVGDKFEYSADTESSMNLTKGMSNNFDPPSHNKENILHCDSLNLVDSPAPVSQENLYVDSKLGNLDLCTTAHEPLPQVTDQWVANNENIIHQQQNKIILNDNSNVNNDRYGTSLNENTHYGQNTEKDKIASDLLQETPVSSIESELRNSNENLPDINVYEKCHISQQNNENISFPFPPKAINESYKTKIEGVDELSSASNEIGGLLESCGENLIKNGDGFEDKSFSFGVPICKNTVLGNAEITKSLEIEPKIIENETNLNQTESSVFNLEPNTTSSDDTKTQKSSSCSVYTGNASVTPELKNNRMSGEQSNVDANNVYVTKENEYTYYFEENPIDTKSSSNEAQKYHVEKPCLNKSGQVDILEGNSCLVTEIPDDEKVDEEDKNKQIVTENVLGDCEENPETGNVSKVVLEENVQPVNENDITKDQFVELNISSNTSLNLSSRSVLSNKNITMTRGRSKSLIITPETSFETCNKESSMLVDDHSSVQLMSDSLNSPIKMDEETLNQFKNTLTLQMSPLHHAVNHKKTGKRSFEEALELENEEESPSKQICLSRDELLTDYLNNVTAPSFLMDPVAASDETLTRSYQQEIRAEVKNQLDSKAFSRSLSKVENTSSNTTSNKISETKVEFSLRMDNSLIPNVSGNLLHQEVIDLCESSFEATTTEVKEIINNSRYKTRNICDDEILTKMKMQNENVHEINVDQKDKIRFAQEHSEQILHPNKITEPCNTNINTDAPTVSSGLEKKVEELATDLLKNNNLNRDFSVSSTDVERKEEELSIDPLRNESLYMDVSVTPSPSADVEIKVEDFSTNPLSIYALDTQLNSNSRRSKELIRNLGNNSYSAVFIPKLLEIHFSVDALGNVNNVNYQSIYSGRNTDIAEYFLKQANNHVLPEKGSDLFHQLQSTNKSFLTRLARNITLICKYHNGSIKENILTLEVASCRRHFWTFIDVNIKYPQFLNETDITISAQKIGELKLSEVRKVFTSIEKNEDQLLNFAKAMTEMQYNN